MPKVPLKQIQQSGATDGQVPVWNASLSQFVAGTVSSSSGLNADITRTSTTSNTISTGSKTFAYASSLNLGWVIGSRLRAINTATTLMEGVVTAVSSTSVTITVDRITGTGTYTSWTLALTGEVSESGTPNIQQIAATAQTSSVTNTESQLTSITITPSSVNSQIIVLATVAFTKDSGTTARATTTRVRWSTGTVTNSSNQVGTDATVTSPGTTLVPFLGLPVITSFSPATTSTITVSLRASISTSATITANAWQFIVFESTPSSTGGGSGFTPSVTSNVSATGTITSAWSTWDNNFLYTTSGNITITNPTGLVAGEKATYTITLGGTHTISFGTAFKWPGNVAPTFGTTTGSVYIIQCWTDGTNVEVTNYYGR